MTLRYIIIRDLLTLFRSSGTLDFVCLSSFLSVSVSLFLSLSSVSVVCVGVRVCVCIYLSSLLSCNPEHNASDSLSVRDVYFALLCFDKCVVLMIVALIILNDI